MIILLFRDNSQSQLLSMTLFIMTVLISCNLYEQFLDVAAGVYLHEYAAYFQYRKNNSCDLQLV